MNKADNPQEPSCAGDLRKVADIPDTPIDRPQQIRLPARVRRLYFIIAIAALVVLSIGLCCLIALVAPLLQQRSAPQVIVLNNDQVQTLVQGVLAQTETARALGLTTPTPYRTEPFVQTPPPQIATSTAAVPAGPGEVPSSGLVIPFGCVSWSQVTLADLGKQMCVAGLALQVEEKEGTLYIRPGTKSGDFFYVASDEPQYRELQGHCLVVEGEIKLLDDSPVMVIYADRVQLCDG